MRELAPRAVLAVLLGGVILAEFRSIIFRKIFGHELFVSMGKEALGLHTSYINAIGTLERVLPIFTEFSFEFDGFGTTGS